jgi:hypothetical protein
MEVLESAIRLILRENLGALRRDLSAGVKPLFSLHKKIVKDEGDGG